MGEALVIDKPGGLPLDTPRAGGPSLADRLDELRLGFQRQPAPVHRLDTDTSGCLLLARNPKALKRFSAAFAERRVAKRYLGILAGIPGDAEGTVELALSKISSAEARVANDPGAQGQAIADPLARDCHGGTAALWWNFCRKRAAPTRFASMRPAASASRCWAIRSMARQRGASRTMLHAAGLELTRDGKPPIAATAPMPADFTALGFVDG